MDNTEPAPEIVGSIVADIKGKIAHYVEIDPVDVAIRQLQYQEREQARREREAVARQQRIERERQEQRRLDELARVRAREEYIARQKIRRAEEDAACERSRQRALASEWNIFKQNLAQLAHQKTHQDAMQRRQILIDSLGSEYRPPEPTPQQVQYVQPSEPQFGEPGWHPDQWMGKPQDRWGKP